MNEFEAYQAGFLSRETLLEAMRLIREIPLPPPPPPEAFLTPGELEALRRWSDHEKFGK